MGLVDVAIPRGGERLIRAMCEAALVPVLKHYKGVCHIYVDDKADLAMALAILDNANVHWQIGEMGKVDEGGGGTVALYIANLDVNVVDLGVPVLSMHAPFEVVAKTDVYSTFKACEAFYKS